MSKKVNLAKALRNDYGCLGFIWRFSNNRYGYQNDNDLGLDLEPLDFKQSYVKKIKLDKDYYVYQVRWGGPDDGTGAGLKTTLALIKECHKHIFNLTRRETLLTEKYWAQF